MSAERTVPSRWLDDFFTAYLADRPVNASFIGVHDHDHALPDFSEHGAGDVLARMQHLLDRAPPVSDNAPRPAEGALQAARGAAAPHDSVTAAERIDVRLATGFLRTQIAEFASTHFHRGNPALYTGEAIFGVLSLFLTDHAPLNQRIAAATGRLRAVPALLEQCRTNVRTAPPTWTQRALRECDGAQAFLTAGVDLLIHGWRRRGSTPVHSAAHEVPVNSAVLAFHEAAAVAQRAFAGHRSWLDDELRNRPSQNHACGEEMLLLYLREGHFLGEDGSAIIAFARDCLADAESRLEHAIAATLAMMPRESGTGDQQTVVDRLADAHPSPVTYYDSFARTWQEMKQLAEARGLLTWPDAPIRFVPFPAWVRSAAPHLYFLHYRSPAAYGRPAVHEHLVTPVEPAMSADAQAAVLRAANDSVIRLNHVIHHAGIGHHVQNSHAYRSASRVGRIAAVDCASRIAMYCGGTMAEGWACYATDLMAEAGALTPLEQCAHLQGRIRLCARAIVDINLNMGRWSIEECAAFYERRAGTPAGAALAEAVKNSMFPGTALMYLMGTEAIHALRRDLAARDSGFTLRGFHDSFLAWGSIPVSVIAAHMKSEDPFVARPAEAAR